jgi:nucleoid DNA-binding protein
MIPATKAELATAVHNRLQLSKRDSALAVDAVVEAMIQALTEGRELRLLNFGRFTTRKRGARPGRNPKTGVPVEITARTVVLFRPSEALKRSVDEATAPPPAEG